MNLSNIKRAMKWILNTETSRTFTKETSFKNLAIWNDEARVLRMVVNDDDLVERIAKEVLAEEERIKELEELLAIEEKPK